ncbi:MAG: hypothetical protein NVSMB19_07080 [Vulcanimicrobiaceae bacterium]
MTATTKFYTGFIIVLALIVTLAFYAGYRAGAHAAATGHERGTAAAHRKAVTTAP